MSKDLWVLLIWIGLLVLSIVGWGLNIIKLFGADTISGEVVVRVIGVFAAPLGAILGYF
jgi:hypothetical protein